MEFFRESAKNTKRQFIGIELDEEIFMIAEERLNQGETF